MILFKYRIAIKKKRKILNFIKSI